MAAARLALLAFGMLAVCLARSAKAAPPSDPSADGSSSTLSLQGAWLGTSDGRRESIALVSLTLPLERLFRPRLAQDSGAPAPDSAEQSASRATTPEDTPPAAAPASGRRTRSVKLLLSPRLARGVLRAALRVAGFPASRARLYSLKSRARSSAVLPSLRLRGARTTDESLRLTPTMDDPYRYTQAGGNSLLFEVRLDWKLDRLIFADEELGVERLERERANAEARLAGRVLKLLVAWQRARLRAGDIELDPEERALSGLEAMEAEIHLDLLTGGWFSEVSGVHNARNQ